MGSENLLYLFLLVVLRPPLVCTFLFDQLRLTCGKQLLLNCVYLGGCTTKKKDHKPKKDAPHIKDGVKGTLREGQSLKLAPCAGSSIIKASLRA